MRKEHYFMFIFLYLMFGAVQAQVGTSCSYKNFEGKAEFNKVDTVLQNGQQWIKITFDFYPNDSLAGEKYDFAVSDSNQVFTVFDGRLLTLIEYNQIKDLLTQRVACKRKEIYKGTCTPVLFEIESLTKMLMPEKPQ